MWFIISSTYPTIFILTACTFVPNHVRMFDQWHSKKKKTWSSPLLATKVVALSQHNIHYTFDMHIHVRCSELHPDETINMIKRFSEPVLKRITERCTFDCMLDQIWNKYSNVALLIICASMSTSTHFIKKLHEIGIDVLTLCYKILSFGSNLLCEL